MTAIQPHGPVVRALLSCEAWITAGDDLTTKTVAPTRLICLLAALVGVPPVAFVLGMMAVRMFQAI